MTIGYLLWQLKNIIESHVPVESEEGFFRTICFLYKSPFWFFWIIASILGVTIYLIIITDPELIKKLEEHKDHYNPERFRLFLVPSIILIIYLIIYLFFLSQITFIQMFCCTLYYLWKIGYSIYWCLTWLLIFRFSSLSQIK